MRIVVGGTPAGREAAATAAPGDGEWDRDLTTTEAGWRVNGRGWLSAKSNVCTKWLVVGDGMPGASATKVTGDAVRSELLPAPRTGVGGLGPEV